MASGCCTPVTSQDMGRLGQAHSMGMRGEALEHPDDCVPHVVGGMGTPTCSPPEESWRFQQGQLLQGWGTYLGAARASRGVIM